VVILKAAAGGPIPLYGDGRNMRDWLTVEDHVDALLLAAAGGGARRHQRRPAEGASGTKLRRFEVASPHSAAHARHCCSSAAEQQRRRIKEALS